MHQPTASLIDMLNRKFRRK